MVIILIDKNILRFLYQDIQKKSLYKINNNTYNIQIVKLFKIVGRISLIISIQLVVDKVVLHYFINKLNKMEIFNIY
jgi:hypothetical protein